jgi:hypothetical protein
MWQADQTFNIDITPHVNEAGGEGLKLTFGGRESSALFLNSPQARALAFRLIERAYHIDVKSSLKQNAPTGS